MPTIWDEYLYAPLKASDTAYRKKMRAKSAKKKTLSKKNQLKRTTIAKKKHKSLF